MSAWSATVSALVVLAASCSGGPSSTSPTTAAAGGGAPPPTPATTTFRTPVIVAIGASDAAGFGADDPAAEAWPQVLARTAFPAGAELVNLGIPGATVAVALERELPEALRRRPTVAAVWLNVNDLLAGVPVATYERQLDELVGALTDGGRTRVLVANTPALDVLPAYVACRSGRRCPIGTVPPPLAVRSAVASYNATIEGVVARHGAVLVDLHGAGVRARERGAGTSLVGADGFHPSTAGHRLVAEAFAGAL